jgi:hypothetical protein
MGLQNVKKLHTVFIIRQKYCKKMLVSGAAYMLALNTASST